MGPDPSLPQNHQRIQIVHVVFILRSTSTTETAIDVGGVRRGEEDAEIGAKHPLWRTPLARLQLSRSNGNGGGCLVADGQRVVAADLPGVTMGSFQLTHELDQAPRTIAVQRVRLSRSSRCGGEEAPLHSSTHMFRDREKRLPRTQQGRTSAIDDGGCRGRRLCSLEFVATQTNGPC